MPNPIEEANDLYQKLQDKLNEAEELNELDRRNNLAEKAARSALLEDERQKKRASPDAPDLAKAQAAYRDNPTPETVAAYWDAWDATRQGIVETNKQTAQADYEKLAAEGKSEFEEAKAAGDLQAMQAAQKKRWAAIEKADQAGLIR